MTGRSTATPPRDKRLAAPTGVAMIASMAVFVSSYAVVKLLCIGAFTASVLVEAHLRRSRIRAHSRLLRFYLWVGLAGAVWTLVGLIRPGTYQQAAPDALKLYVAWSAAFAVLYTFLRAGPSLRIVHVAMLVAGILIPIINFVGLADQLAGLGLVPDAVREELNLKIGLGDGYFQYASENIRAMFVVAPYLLALQFRVDATEWNPRLTRLALVLSLALVAVSGRRALWLVIAATPVLILVLSKLTAGHGLLRVNGRRLLVAWTAAGCLGLGFLLALPEGELEGGPIARLQQAFSSEDERSLQAPYLIEAFQRHPVVGSGFGGHARYQRSDDSPWQYELTYHTVLFNMGMIGAGLLAALYAGYVLHVLRLLKSFPVGSAVPFGLLIGVLSLLLGAYSNPYFGGFDGLFLGGLIPYLSTFEQGFEEPGNEQS